MGVLSAKRKESTMQFITTAIELKVFSAKMGIKLPQKYNKYGTSQAYALADTIVSDLIKANSLYFTKDRTENYQARQTLFTRALGNLNCLSEHIVFLCDLVDENLGKGDKNKKVKVTPKQWLKWANLINQEIGLVKSIKDSDTQRLPK